MASVSQYNPRLISSAKRHPCTTIFLIALGLRLLTAALLRLCVSLQSEPFDASHLLLDDGSAYATGHLAKALATPRWDAIHFVAIAQRGYEWEQLLAFQPGWPLLFRYTALGLRLFRGIALPGETLGVGKGVGQVLGVEEVVLVGQVLAWLSYAGAAVMLFRLTKHLLPLHTAYTTTILYLLAPSPAVMSSPYGEPLFALLVFSGYYLCLHGRFWIASALLAGATSVRATGVVNVGVLGWMGLFGGEAPAVVLRRPKVLLRRALKIALPAAIITLPFVITQIHWYQQFCLPPNAASGVPGWCRKRLPLIYTHVQEKYWNVGLLNYWSPAQIPNLLIAAPILSISFYGAYRFFASAIISSPAPTTSHSPTTSTAKPHSPAASPASKWALFPFYITHLVLTLLLTFSAHSQIALRLCVTDPVVWWTAAQLAFTGRGIAPTTGSRGRAVDDEKTARITTFGRVWVWWSVVYGAISIPLWAGHYPPA